jgi:hypothetical protein
MTPSYDTTKEVHLANPHHFTLHIIHLLLLLLQVPDYFV